MPARCGRVPTKETISHSLWYYSSSPGLLLSTFMPFISLDYLTDRPCSQSNAFPADMLRPDRCQLSLLLVFALHCLALSGLELYSSFYFFFVTISQRRIFWLRSLTSHPRPAPSRKIGSDFAGYEDLTSLTRPSSDSIVSCFPQSHTANASFFICPLQVCCYLGQSQLLSSCKAESVPTFSSGFTRLLIYFNQCLQWNCLPFFTLRTGAAVEVGRAPK